MKVLGKLVDFNKVYLTWSYTFICRKDLLGVFEELKSRAFKSGSEPLEPAVEHVQPLNKREDVERA